MKNIKIKILIFAAIMIAGLVLEAPKARAGVLIRRTIGGKVANTNIAISPTNYLTSDLVGYWTMDGSKVNWATGAVTDSSGRGNTGYIKNMATSTAVAAGKIGQALKFDGTDDYVNIAPITLGTTYTVSAWIKTDSITTNRAIFAQRAIGTAGNLGIHFQLDHNSAAVRFIVRDNAGNIATANYNSAITTANWFYVVGVRDGGTVSVYVNGVKGTDDIDTFGAITSPSATIGEFAAYTTGLNFLGLIDEVRVYNCALSASEISQLYWSGAAKFNVSPTNYLTSGLVGYWTMDGSEINWATGAVTDSSGRGNTGYIKNMATSTAVAAGKIGQALSFDGTDDYVDIGTGPTVVNTVAFWVYPTATTNYFTNITGTAKYIWANTGTVTATGFTAAPTIYVNGQVSSTIVANQWQFITLVTTTAENASNLDIGRTQDANYMSGKIDEVRVYNRALSVNEISQLYNAGR